MKKQFQYRKMFLAALLFIISLSGIAQQQFIHTATKANNSCNGDCTQLDNPDLNNNPDAILFVTPILDGGVNLNPHLIGVYYTNKKWNIFNLDQKALPEGSKFNVQYSTKPDATRFKYSITNENIRKDGSAYIDHPSLTNNQAIEFVLFPSWIPVDGGAANRYEIKTQFDPTTGKWFIKNINERYLYARIAYNIAVSSSDIVNKRDSGSSKAVEIRELIIRPTIAETTTPPVAVEGDPIALIKTPKTNIQPADTLPNANSPIDKNEIVPKKTIPKSYDFSRVKICVDQVFNKILPAKVHPAAIPKVNSNGVIEPVTSITQSLSGLTEFMWSADEKITVAFNPGSPADFITKVKLYAKEWETYANITFDFITSVSNAKIKVGFTQDKTSWSWIGRDVLDNSNNYKTMNFGWFTTETPDEEFRRIILHEFGHALGFIHEHQAAGAGIAWDRDKVYSYFGAEPRNWDTTKIDANIFTTYSKTSTNSSAYDRLSIMHYFFPSDLTTDGSSFTENSNLSTIDKSFAKQVYPFPPTATGILRTGDDCDEIEFTIEYGVVPRTEIEFVLLPGLDHHNVMVNWWKMIGIPVNDLPAIRGLFLNTTKKIQTTWIDRTKPITFGKAKILGVHTGLPFTWNVWPAIVGGCRVKFVWRRDSCN